MLTIWNLFFPKKSDYKLFPKHNISVSMNPTYPTLKIYLKDNLY